MAKKRSKNKPTECPSLIMNNKKDQLLSKICIERVLETDVKCSCLDNIHNVYIDISLVT